MLSQGRGGVLALDYDADYRDWRDALPLSSSLPLAFSLAGAQAKTALHLDTVTGQWGDPSGAIPTTHILKPAITGFDDHDLNCVKALDGA